MKKYIRDWNQRGYLFELTEEVIKKLKTYRLLGIEEVKMPSPCIMSQDLVVRNERINADIAFRNGDFKVTAEYYGNDIWLIKLWLQ